MSVTEPVGGLPVTMLNGVSYDIRTGLVKELGVVDPAESKLYWRGHVYLGGVELFRTKPCRTEEEAHQEGLEWARAHSRKK